MKDVTTLRATLDYLLTQNEVLRTDVEIDPHLEIAALQKALDNGPALLFERIKGYPNARFAANVFSRLDRLPKLFDAPDLPELKQRIRQGFRKPVPCKLVKDAPCQEVVITKDINVWDIVPMISHTAKDSGRTLGGGISCVVGKYFEGGTHIGFNRMSFLPDRKDFSTFQIAPGSHMWQIATKYYKKERIPLTMCMGLPPACYLVAGSGFNYLSLPAGADEIGLAGVIQGSPIEVVKARTLEDGYALANADIVLEGYLDTWERLWETPEAEAAQKQGVMPFHPEWSGYMGRAYRTYKFQVTAITYRQDRPLYYSPIVHGYDDHNINAVVREASFIELAERICPGLVVDAYIPLGMTDWGGVIFQVRKRSQFDEGYQKNILAATISFSQGMRLAIAVDEDINLYEPEDILWALTTRVEADRDIQIVAPGGRGQTFQPAERAAAAPGREWVSHETRYSGGIAIDATVPFQFKDVFDRPEYPVKRVDLSHWYSPEQLTWAQTLQGAYAKFFAKTGI